MWGGDYAFNKTVLTKRGNGGRNITRDLCIEEGWRQKLRQNVVVLEWGARSNAALGILV